MPEDTIPTGPAPSPEIPLVLHVDGTLGAVDLIRRLHAAGLALRQGSEDAFAVLTLAERATQPVSGARRQLVRAVGIVAAVGGVLNAADHILIDEGQLANALEAASNLIDEAAAQLEQVQP